MRLFPCLIALSMTAAAASEAQQPPTPPPVDSVTLVRVRLLDGSELLGHVIAKDDSMLTVETATGLRAVVLTRTVADWRQVQGRTVRGAFRRDDPNASRLFFTATGRTMGAGEAYIADYFLFLPFVAVGITGRIMAAAGVSLLPGVESQLLYFAPKIGIVKSPRLNVAIGGIVAGIPEEGTIGAGYGVVTVGSEDNALTVLLGVPFGEGLDSPGRPGFVFGAEARTSNTSKFMTEIWNVPGVAEVPVLFGMRVFGDRLAVDFGLWHVFGADMSGWPFFPWVDFAINFGGGARGRAAPAQRITGPSRFRPW